MHKIGGHVSMAGGLVNVAKNSVVIGGNCAQFFAGSPRSWDRRLFTNEEVNEFKKSLEGKNILPLFIHALYLVNLAAESEETLKKSLISLEMDMKNADLLGVLGVVVHLGSHLGRGFEGSLNVVVKSIETLIEKTEKTNFIMENSAGQQGKIGSIVELGMLADKVKSDRLRICLDSAHLFAAGYDLREKSVIDQIVSELEANGLLNKIDCLHLNDSKPKCGSKRDIHANLGEGEIGIEGLKNLVRHPAFENLPIILEVPGDPSAKVKGPDAKNIQIANSLFD